MGLRRPLPQHQFVGLGNANYDGSPTNLTGGMVYPYIKSVSTYHCTADKNYILNFGTGQPTSTNRLRCFSMSCYLNGDPETEAQFGIEHLSKVADLHHVANILVFIDEDDSTIDDGYFLYPFAINAYAGLNWVNVPGFRHSNGTVWSFADGHAAYKRWRTPRAQVVADLERNSPADIPAERDDLKDLEATSPQNPGNL